MSKLAAKMGAASAWLSLLGFVALAVATSVGCHSVLPGSLAGLTTPRQEKKILEQAEVDPFPSPADVGLSSSASSADATP